MRRGHARQRSAISRKLKWSGNFVWAVATENGDAINKDMVLDANGDIRIAQARTKASERLWPLLAPSATLIVTFTLLNLWLFTLPMPHRM